MANDPAESLAYDIERIKKNQRDKGSTPQLGRSSIEDGKIEEYDVNGVLKQVIGKQPDGTNTTVQVNGPLPPAPSAPTVTELTEAARVAWDGTWETGAVAPLDLARIDVHLVGDESDDPLTHAPAATIAAQGWGEASVPIAPGVYYAVLVARTTSGKWATSELSDPFTVDAVALPPSSDGNPPTETAAPILVGGQGVMYARVPVIDPAGDAITEVRFYASTTSPVTTSSTLVGVTPNGGTTAFTSVNGQPVEAGVDYHVAAVLWDADGAGSLSAESVGQVDDPIELPITETMIADNAISTPKLRAGSVTAAKVGADVMVTNDLYARDRVTAGNPAAGGVEISQARGIQQTYADGRSRVSMPTDPDQPNVINADLYTQGLTIEGKMSVRGTDNEISRASVVKLATGTTPPTTSLAIQGNQWGLMPGMPSVSALGGANASDTNGLWRDGTTWKLAQRRAGTSPRIVTVSDAGAVSYQNLTMPATYNDRTPASLVKVGTRWYMLILGGSFDVAVFDASFGYIGAWTAPTSTGSSYVVFAPGFTTDGTSLYFLPTPGTAGAQLIRTDVSGVVQSAATLAGVTETSVLTTMAIGSFDFGAPRLIVSLDYNNTARSFDLAGAAKPAENFELASSGRAIGWDGTRFVQLTYLDFRQASTLKVDRTLKAAYEWYDSDAAGTGTHASGIGQEVTFVQKARCAVQFTAPPPNDAGDPDNPDTSRLYVGTTAANHRQGSPFVVSTTLLDFDPTVGAAPGVNTFPAGVAARFESASGLSYFAGDDAVAFPVLEARVAGAAAADATTKANAAKDRANHNGTQAASTISDIDTRVRSSRIDQMAIPTAPVNHNMQRLYGLADGTAANDGVNKAQMEAANNLKQVVLARESFPVATTKTIPNGSWYEIQQSTATPSTRTGATRVFLKGHANARAAGNQSMEAELQISRNNGSTWSVVDSGFAHNGTDQYYSLSTFMTGWADVALTDVLRFRLVVLAGNGVQSYTTSSIITVQYFR